MKWTEISLLGNFTLLEFQSVHAAWMDRMGCFLPYCIQIGGLVGSTLGLILGEVRFQYQQRTLAAPALSNSQ